MPYAYRGRRISVLVSQSKDGELIARTVARLGIDSSRGSSSRGGIAGMRSLLRKAAEGWDIAFTPDGPRGPLREVQPGVILAAASTGLPILPVAIAASRAKLLRSWDRFMVPLPFSTVHFVYGEPLAVERAGDPGAPRPSSSGGWSGGGGGGALAKSGRMLGRHASPDRPLEGSRMRSMTGYGEASGRTPGMGSR